MAPLTGNLRARVWLLSATTALASGCALVSGLDQFEKGDAESPDVVSDQTVGDAPNDAKDSSTFDVVDSGNDVTNVDASDGSSEASDAGDASDAIVVVDSGDCGTPNTVKDCTMCGASCNGTNASATSCTGTTCQYTCKGGFSNCSNAAPDLDGCECATPSCCGASCATTHANGTGQNYYDCVDAGTMNQTQAAKACTAYTNDQFACNAATCIGDAGDLVICGFPDGGTCACWDYAGTDTSHVYKSGSTTCFCPSTIDPSWN